MSGADGSSHQDFPDDDRARFEKNKGKFGSKEGKEKERKPPDLSEEHFRRLTEYEIAEPVTADPGPELESESDEEWDTELYEAEKKTQEPSDSAHNEESTEKKKKTSKESANEERTEKKKKKRETARHEEGAEKKDEVLIEPGSAPDYFTPDSAGPAKDGLLYEKPSKQAVAKVVTSDDEIEKSTLKKKKSRSAMKVAVAMEKSHGSSRRKKKEKLDSPESKSQHKKKKEADPNEVQAKIRKKKSMAGKHKHKPKSDHGASPGASPGAAGPSGSPGPSGAPSPRRKKLRPPVAKQSKTLTSRLKNGFQTVSRAFSFSKADFDKTFRKAEEKRKSSTKVTMEDDEAFPTMSAAKDPEAKEEGEEGGTTAATTQLAEDFGPYMNDKTHRADLELIKNNENEGKLHHQGKPFWNLKSTKKANPLPPIPKKVTTEILFEIAANKFHLAPQEPTPENLDGMGDFDEMKKRDNTYFGLRFVQSNTVRSVIGVTAVGETSNKSSTSMNSHKLVPLNVVAPNTQLVYKKHIHPAQAASTAQVTLFKKSNLGVIGKKKSDKNKDTNSTSTSSASSRSSTEKSTRNPSHRKVKTPAPAAPHAAKPRKVLSTRK